MTWSSKLKNKWFNFELYAHNTLYAPNDDKLSALFPFHFRFRVQILKFLSKEWCLDLYILYKNVYIMYNMSIKCIWNAYKSIVCL